MTRYPLYAVVLMLLVVVVLAPVVVAQEEQVPVVVLMDERYTILPMGLPRLPQLTGYWSSQPGYSDLNVQKERDEDLVIVRYNGSVVQVIHSDVDLRGVMLPPAPGPMERFGFILPEGHLLLMINEQMVWLFEIRDAYKPRWVTVSVQGKPVWTAKP